MYVRIGTVTEPPPARQRRFLIAPSVVCRAPLCADKAEVIEFEQARATLRQDAPQLSGDVQRRAIGVDEDPVSRILTFTGSGDVLPALTAH